MHSFPNFLELEIVMQNMLITGASGGIGSAIALEASKRGINLALCAHCHFEECQAIANQARENGVTVITLHGDLADINESIRIFVEAYEMLGGINILVNNAGFLHQHAFENIPAEEWDYTFNINLRAPYLLSQQFFKKAKLHGGGRIVNIASSGGQLGGPLAPHYAASKAALICLTRSLARLGAPYNIITFAVSPGLVLTEMATAEINSVAGREKLKNIPLGRAATTTEVARVVCDLVTGDFDYATGQTVNLNGGLYMG